MNVQNINIIMMVVVMCVCVWWWWGGWGGHLAILHTNSTYMHMQYRLE